MLFIERQGESIAGTISGISKDDRYPGYSRYRSCCFFSVQNLYHAEKYQGCGISQRTDGAGIPGYRQQMAEPSRHQLDSGKSHNHDDGCAARGFPAGTAPRRIELDEAELKDMIETVANATVIMGQRKIGALIVFERAVGLEERIETGVAIDGLVTDSLLLNIFEKDTPLHDGAVIIRGNRIVAASCLLPLTEARGLSQELGTRHRAAIGISEQSDALVVVVSEETGTVSVTRNGEIYRYLRREDVVDMLQSALMGHHHFTLKQLVLEKLDDYRNKRAEEANDASKIAKPGGKS